MDKYFVEADGSKHKLSPITVDEYCELVGYLLDPPGLTYMEFLQANGWITLSDLSVQQVAAGHVEIWDGDARLHWVNGEWQAEYTHKEGFPQDDSLVQWAGNDWNLDVFYSSQFVQNEMQQKHVGNGLHFDSTTNYYLERTPVLIGTVTGTIYFDDKPIQSFHDNNDGMFLLKTMKPVDESAILVFDMSLKYNTGEITMSWNDVIDLSKAKIVVSYEYNLEGGPKYKPYQKTIKNQVEID